MKKLFLLLALLLLAGSLPGVEFPRGERRIKYSQTQKAVKQIEIAVPERTPILKFAADELQRFIAEATGIKAAVVKNPSAGKVSLVLGDNKFSRAAGLDVKKLASEGFFIKRKGDMIFLVGEDDPQASPYNNRWRMWMRRGTLTAAYDFLERFLGVRFYFVGKLGTIVPKSKQLMLPVEIDIMDRPDLIGRDNYSGNQAVWYEKSNKYLGGLYGYNLSFLRQRYSDRPIPFGHGLANLNLIQRYGKTHPEYFALTPDGRRYKEADHVHPGHICYHSGIVEEIYKDVKTFLTGGKASSRGLKYWNVNFGSRPYVSIMPQDWFYWCCCEKCKKIAPGGRVYQNDPKAAKAISEFMWKNTADFANRLKKDKINGVITQMAYGVTDIVPQCEIPDNVAIQLAVKGMGKPSLWKDDIALLKKWYDKSNGKISIWTYPGKHMSKAEMKGIPAMMHRQTGKYIQHVAKYIYGVFLESETDYELFHYLNYYTFAKVSWDLTTDVDKLLAEHYKLMFGAGAKEMKAFFDELEVIWCDRIIGNITNTPLGPVPKLPNEFELWSKILSPAKLNQLKSFLDRAAKAAAKDPAAVARIELMRREIFGHIMASAKKFYAAREIIDNWTFNAPGKIGLRPYQGDVCEVETQVEVKENADSFSFIYACEEPEMKNIRAGRKGKDNEMAFEDSCVELFLNPSGDRKNYYHIFVNTNGSFADSAWVKNGKGDYSWDSKAEFNVVKNAKGYNISITIPKAVLGKYNKAGFPVNFARHRSLLGDAAKKVKVIYYQWSPVPGRSFHAIERWGVMNLGKQESGNFIKDGGFDNVKNIMPYYAGKWGCWSSMGYKNKSWVELDNKVFLTGTSSLHFTNKNGQRVSAGQTFYGLKPNKKYRLSFFMRTKNISGKDGAGGYLTIGKRHIACPITRVSGTTGWHRRSFDFTTGKDVTPQTKCIIGLWIWFAGGEAWYDDVTITEVK